MKICLYDSGIGVIPFLKVILRKKIYNDYYLYIDDNNFPYGDKSDEELLKILKKVINYVEDNNFDYLFICCNTISRIFLNNQIESKVKVKTILEENIKDNKEFKLLCTPNLSNNINNSINGNNLAKYITDNNLYKIIEFINCIKKEKIIKTSSNENDTVLDCFMGSGSTGIACINTNRKFIGIEKDEKYFEIACNRIKEVKK